MGPKTEELLNILLWSADLLVNPSWRSLFESYEGWAYRNGLLIQIGRLEQRKWVTRKSKARNDRVYRLSAQGRDRKSTRLNSSHVSISYAVFCLKKKKKKKKNIIVQYKKIQISSYIHN